MCTSFRRNDIINKALKNSMDKRTDQMDTHLTKTFKYKFQKKSEWKQADYNNTEYFIWYTDLKSSKELKRAYTEKLTIIYYTRKKQLCI